MSEHAPITAELRAALDVDREFMRADGAVVAQTFCVDRDDFHRLCDAIDAVHAGLERENEELRERLAALENRSESMHIGGSITDELRAWVRDGKGSLLAIADRIDAEHEAKVSYWQGASYKDGYDEGFASADDWLAQHEDAMAEHGWVRMPKDADGEYIHIGDVMKNTVCPSVHREVTGVGAECFYGWDEGNGRYSQFDANCYRHHHAPTVEDVLREFAEEMNENLGMYTGEAIEADEWRDADAKTIAEYAARLRLAGMEDE